MGIPASSATAVQSDWWSRLRLVHPLDAVDFETRWRRRGKLHARPGRVFPSALESREPGPSARAHLKVKRPRANLQIGDVGYHDWTANAVHPHRAATDDAATNAT